jgi:nucleotide-binding universal stress UspA family protein
VCRGRTLQGRSDRRRFARLPMNPAEPTPTKARPVLACVADNARGKLVAAVACEWADMLGVEPLLLNVAPDENAAEEARERWADWGTAFTAVARRGAVDRMIRQHAQQRDAQLVILGALEQDGVWTSLVGSVARRVARYATCSVLLVPHPEKPTYGRVVASVRFDDRSMSLLRYLGQLATRRPPERVHALYEVQGYGDLVRTLGGRGSAVTEWRKDLDTDTQAEIDSMLQVAGLQDCAKRVVCLEGHAGQEGVDYAERVDADLLASPAPAKLRLLDRFFKQPTELVLQNLPCALLMYRPQSGAK